MSTNNNDKKNTQGGQNNDHGTQKQAGQPDKQNPGQGGQKPAVEPEKQTPAKGNDKR